MRIKQYVFNERFDRITIDGRGYITSGIKSESGKGKSINGFVVDDFKELVQTYGVNPQKLVVYPPSDDIDSFVNEEYNLYGSKGADAVKIRSCDGVTCVHRINEEITFADGTVHRYAAGEETQCICGLMPETIEKNGEIINNPRRCKYVCMIDFYIGLPPTYSVANPAAYRFITHSANSGAGVISELNNIKALAKRLKYLPFILSVKMVSSKERANVKFPIWHLQFASQVKKILELPDEDKIVKGLDNDEIKMITEGRVEIVDEKSDVVEQNKEERISTEQREKIFELLEKYRVDAKELKKFLIGYYKDKFQFTSSEQILKKDVDIIYQWIETYNKNLEEK